MEDEEEFEEEKADDSNDNINKSNLSLNIKKPLKFSPRPKMSTHSESLGNVSLKINVLFQKYF